MESTVNGEIQSDLTREEVASIEGENLYNDDLAPVSSAARKWGTRDIAFLWVGMSVCIPAYYNYAWFTGFILALAVYYALMTVMPKGKGPHEIH